MQFLRLFWAFAFSAALSSCGSPRPVPALTPPEAPAAPPALLWLPEAAPRPLAAFARARVRLEHSQRDAHTLPGGVTRLDLDVPPGSSAIHFSLLPAEGSRVEVSLYQGGKGAALAPAEDASQWTQRSAPAEKDGTASLVLRSDKPFHLAWFAAVPRVSPKPDVLVYLIDTMRQDHLSAYHYPLETTPAIDAFARDATVFRNLMPMSSWTRPSVTSLLTGTMDYTHHVFGADDRVREGLPSLARALQQDGRETCAIITNPAVASSFGTGLDFQWSREFWSLDFVPGWEEDQHAVEQAIDFISGVKGQPFFLYLHTMAPHREYDAHNDYADLYMPDKFVGTAGQVRIQRDLALYDAEIRFSDDQFSRVITALKGAGRYDNALIVLISDHGEQFMEHGRMAHAQSLHREELIVPCLVKLPGNWHAPNTIRHTVQMADIAPTILAALGLAPDPGMDGRSLLPLMDQGGTFPPRPGFARLRFEERHFYTAQTEYLKYLYDVNLGESTWYNLADDAEELVPLRQPPGGGAELKAFADDIAAKPVPKPGETSAPLTDGESESLKALGYL